MVRREAGLPDVRLHDLRHSYASYGARRGLPLPVTQRLLGHKDVESTAIYTHFDNGHLIEVSARVAENIRQACAGLKPRQRWREALSSRAVNGQWQQNGLPTAAPAPPAQQSAGLLPDLRQLDMGF